MILIQWLKFLFLIYNFILSTNYTLSTNYIFSSQCFNLRFRIYDLHSYSILFKNILSSSSFLFFPSSYYFPFIYFPHFPFVFFFLSLFSSFFFFSQIASFPQFCLPFPKSAAPVLPHFLLPCCVFLSMSRWRDRNSRASKSTGAPLPEKKYGWQKN